jgi:hypothetical protein
MMLRSVCCLTLLAACSNSNPVTDAGVDASNSCAAPTGAGTPHVDAIAANETWTAAGSPHLVTASIKVNAGVTLTIEPCATVKLGGSNHIEVDGTLVAEGTADKPITFAQNDAQPWGYVNVYAPGTISLAYATLTGGGGDETNAYGAIEARGDQTAPAQAILKVRNVTVASSAAYGVSIRAGGAFTADSSALVVTGSKKAPLRINPRLATTVPTGTYTGNGTDAIVVETEAYGDVNVEDVTFHDRGVPYQIGGEKTVGTFKVGGGSALSTLTIDPNVSFRFIKGGVLHVDTGSTSSAATGALVAKGSATQPIVFTSAATPPAAGDWVGLDFGNVPSATDKLDHIEVHYAGADPQANGFHCMPNGTVSTNEDAAISIYGQPTAGMITNSLFADIAGAGINLAYKGTAVDFLTGNTFTNVTGCKVTTPKDLSGSCPTSSPCP